MKTLLALCILSWSSALYAVADAPDFAQEVRPILSDRCFGCHGPAEQESDLRLDTAEGATEWAITPGSAEESEVIARVLLPADDEMRMPPIHSEVKPLTEEEVDILRRWIDAGAEYQQHWAFAPIERPTPPLSVEAETMIDAFVVQRLKQKGLSFRPEADRRILARRASFDLTGLPPTPELVEEFVSDDSPEAYGRYVDRLLASPRYGEHMARYWLDAIRYADTHGKHFDNYREIWLYRDWVVNSLNTNKPYDKFLIEQLAGDLLPSPNHDQMIATGFNRCNLTTNEGGVIEQECYTDNVRDRTDAFGAVVLGLTVACAKCHDHKYDPITQKDYYSLFAFFNSLDGGPLDRNIKNHAPSMQFPSEQQQQQMADLQAKSDELEAQLLRDNPVYDKAQKEWEEALSLLAKPNIANDTLSTSLVEASDWWVAGPFAAGGNSVNWNKFPPEKQPFNPADTFNLGSGKKSGWRKRPDWVDGQIHYDLPGGRSVHYLYRKLNATSATEIEVSLGSDDLLNVMLNGKKILSHNKKERRVEKDSERVKLELKEGENELLLRIGNYGDQCGFYFHVTGGALILPTEATSLAATPQKQRTPEQQEQLRQAFRFRTKAFAELLALRKELADARISWCDEQRSVPSSLVFREREKPRPAYVLKRGEYDNEGEEVSRATPSFLPPLPEEAPLNRLGLAQWTVSPQNPLPARVAVNRLWQQVFGVGLVKTADDFGSQAEPPSHPQLLDWLAADFIDSGWNIKRMMKQIVMTQAYRQTSAAPPELWKQDPENRLLARGPRFRLDGEMLRDQALAISGLLVNRVGGPPVKPPQPDGLWKAVAYEGSNTKIFVADKEHEKVHRRSLYTFHKRTSAPPQMLTFDGPTRESCTLRRERTNTPLQALLLMNDPQYVEAARALAERTLRESPESAAEQAAYMFNLATSRLATEEEIQGLTLMVQTERDRFTEQPKEAAAFLSVGISPLSESVDQAELAAWMMAANLVLNLDEVVSKN